MIDIDDLKECNLELTNIKIKPSSLKIFFKRANFNNIDSITFIKRKCSPWEITIGGLFSLDDMKAVFNFCEYLQSAKNLEEELKNYEI